MSNSNISHLIVPKNNYLSFRAPTFHQQFSFVSIFNSPKEFQETSKEKVDPLSLIGFKIQAISNEMFLSVNMCVRLYIQEGTRLKIINLMNESAHLNLCKP